MNIDKLDEIGNKYNNTYNKTIKMKPVDLESRMYFDFNKENDKEGPKFKVGDHIRILRHINIFTKCYVRNWSDEVFVIKKIKILCRGHMLLVILVEKNSLKRFMKKYCKKHFKEEFRVEKVIRRKVINYI